MNYVNQLCRKHTSLSTEDVNILLSITSSLPYIADLVRADVFIDILSEDRDVAIVLAEAKPTNAPSLYKQSVIGQKALRVNEPAVLRTFDTGETSVEIRGVTQEGIPVKQTVTSILNKDKNVIAVLILEQDITEQLEQEARVELLSNTTERLTSTLLDLTMVEQVLPTMLHDALLIVTLEGLISYANPAAVYMFCDIHGENTVLGQKITTLLNNLAIDKAASDVYGQPYELQFRQSVLLVKSVPLTRAEVQIGWIYLIRDITDLREKEKQLIVKSTVIREIHHRVKNNLQTIASLLRLQMRRTDSEILKEAFQESIARIMSISLIHEVFAKEIQETVEIRDVTEHIAGLVSQSFVDNSKEINISVAGDKACLQSHQASALALIINELMQNSLKHAFSEKNCGNIGINFCLQKNDLEITVADNGIGLPEGFELNKNSNLGLQVVTTLIHDDLRGEFSISSKNGTEVKINFPLEWQEGDICA